MTKAHPVAMFGHSEGGALTVASVLADHRLLGGINLDGAFYGPPLNPNASIDVPFAILSSSIHNQSTSPSWPIVWDKLKANKWQIQRKDSEHASYGDFGSLIDLWGLKRMKVLDGVVGGISGKDAIKVVSDLAKVFFDFTFGKLSAGAVVDVAENLGL